MLSCCKLGHINDHHPVLNQCHSHMHPSVPVSSVEIGPPGKTVPQSLSRTPPMSAQPFRSPCNPG